jgi:hypothetical protein
MGMSPADAECVQFSSSRPSTRHIIVRAQLEASVGSKTAGETTFGAEDVVMSWKSARRRRERVRWRDRDLSIGGVDRDGVRTAGEGLVVDVGLDPLVLVREYHPSQGEPGLYLVDGQSGNVWAMQLENPVESGDVAELDCLRPATVNVARADALEEWTEAGATVGTSELLFEAGKSEDLYVTSHSPDDLREHC